MSSGIVCEKCDKFYTLQGRVTDTRGDPLADVLVTYDSDDPAAPLLAKTATDGTYTHAFKRTRAGWSGINFRFNKKGYAQGISQPFTDAEAGWDEPCGAITITRDIVLQDE